MRRGVYHLCLLCKSDNSRRDKRFGFAIRDVFDTLYLPEPSDERALLALALMREGRGLNHPGYAFLSFYRVLEVAFPDGRTRGRWISDNLDGVTDRQAKEALSALKETGVSDVGVHLRDSGRRAIAHAREKPIIDPDNPSDIRRLRSELPIIRSLAQMAVEQSLKVETRHTVWEKHLYELAGFKRIFGAELIGSILNSDAMSSENTVDIPEINVGLYNHDAYKAFLGLGPIGLDRCGSTVIVRFGSSNGLLQIRLGLNFAEERLDFDVFSDLKVFDNGGAVAAEAISEAKMFFRDYMANGKLIIFDAETNEILSHKDAFIPLNMFLDFDGANREIARWKNLALQRREFDRAYGDKFARWLIPYVVRCDLVLASEAVVSPQEEIGLQGE